MCTHAYYIIITRNFFSLTFITLSFSQWRICIWCLPSPRRLVGIHLLMIAGYIVVVNNNNDNTITNNNNDTSLWLMTCQPWFSGSNLTHIRAWSHITTIIIIILSLLFFSRLVRGCEQCSRHLCEYCVFQGHGYEAPIVINDNLILFMSIIITIIIIIDDGFELLVNREICMVWNGAFFRSRKTKHI